ncbi:TPA: DNA adenine methylase [Staphylococcus aureus]|nr:DNA adenine methylase [Staphylococcus aureus]QPV67706.1 DNA adenine methylase [Staphylococcus aureus]HBC8027382.1 DNA adenine methylase [Staphylococcus aureus]HCT1235708.1 DNA adenine methylase [Staphylococcus aureus]HCT1237634.1 DNA adenine methylase [Staphylococcus aureus]HCU0377840.1 DNA adenine methylase [Staphylococcus aureus]
MWLIGFKRYLLCYNYSNKNFKLRLDYNLVRFIGNKNALKDDIRNFLMTKNLLKKNLTFFDAFCGTGSISDYLKDDFNIIANDNLKWCTIYTKGRAVEHRCKFEGMPYDPFEFLNNSKGFIEGFFYSNYTPANSNRMYFTEKNGGRIDYFRVTIEEWYINRMINFEEYAYLLACLIDSVSLVSNTAGVYGAFLKTWDPRALKDIKFVRLKSESKRTLDSIKIKNNKVEDIIREINCDVLYLDPPYTQNQYGTQYHLLETLVLYDSPSISSITGSRSTKPMRSDWSKDIKAHILLDEILANTKAKYIILSYSIDGIMSKQFIESCFKRYGKPETYEFKKIEYKKYRNWKTKRGNTHYEYIFYIEKKDKPLYESPLNYIGSKYKYLNQIEPLIPKNIKKFYDIFGGGYNLGINVNAKENIYNDFNHLVTGLIKSFQDYDTYSYIRFIRKVEKKFDLKPANKEGYLKARKYYNQLPDSKKDPRFLYSIILYGFQQQIRFNSKYEFNNPVGMRWFNDKVLEKFISFSRYIKSGNHSFRSKDYTDLIDEIDSDSFVYLDPPYRFTLGSYNDGKRGFKGWSNREEQELQKFCEDLNEKGIKFMLSYVLKHKEEYNIDMDFWAMWNKFKILELNDVPGKSRKEVVIINYERK